MSGLPEPFRRVAGTARFWTDLFHNASVSHSGPNGFPKTRIELAVGPVHGFAIEISTQPLQLFGVLSGRAWSIARIDGNHGLTPGHVIDPEELDLIARAVASLDPELPHPGYTVMLLHGFCRTVKRTDVAYLDRLLDAAFEATNVLAEGARVRHKTRLKRILSGVASTWRTSQATPLDDRGTDQLQPYDEILRIARITYAEAITVAERTPSVVKLAESYAKTKDHDILAVLHDALIEAGCDTPGVLSALRPSHPLHAEWVIERILD